MNKQLKDYAKGKGIPVSVLAWVWQNLHRIEEFIQLLKYIRDTFGNKNESRLACGPKPPPRLDPGYWECVGGEWVWVPGV